MFCLLQSIFESFVVMVVAGLAVHLWSLYSRIRILPS